MSAAPIAGVRGSSIVKEWCTVTRSHDYQLSNSKGYLVGGSNRDKLLHPDVRNAGVHASAVNWRQGRSPLGQYGSQHGWFRAWF
jgi:hypothetical protein